MRLNVYFHLCSFNFYEHEREKKKKNKPSTISWLEILELQTSSRLCMELIYWLASLVLLSYQAGNETNETPTNERVNELTNFLSIITRPNGSQCYAISYWEKKKERVFYAGSIEYIVWTTWNFLIHIPSIRMAPTRTSNRHVCSNITLQLISSGSKPFGAIFLLLQALIYIFISELEESLSIFLAAKANSFQTRLDWCCYHLSHPSHPSLLTLAIKLGLSLRIKLWNV